MVKLLFLVVNCYISDGAGADDADHGARISSFELARRFQHDFHQLCLTIDLHFLEH